MESYIKCPKCKTENVYVKIDLEQLNVKNPMKLLSKVREAKNDPSKSNITEIYPCRRCASIPQETREKHLIKHGGVKCGECEYTSNSVEDMLEHLAEEHGHRTTLQQKQEQGSPEFVYYRTDQDE